MESALTSRDKVGVQDAVLLEDHESEDSFVGNLEKRYRENLIYTYIGSVLVAVNPYQKLKFYDDKHVKQYQGCTLYEMPPHIYAISDSVYHVMRDEARDQCIIISGESGSGKTESTKYILHHLSATSSSTMMTSSSSREVTINQKLIQLNPILEAFGNAKTHRNDNSSRFGKYMDVRFDFRGTPVGGNILNYLLEKSRVVHQAVGERNFHVFYHLLAGCDAAVMKKLGLTRNSDDYFYTSQGKCGQQRGAGSTNDEAEFKSVHNALRVFDFSSQEIENLFAVLAFILRLGNVGFVVGSSDNGEACVADENEVKKLAQLIGCGELGESLTHRSIRANFETVRTPLTPELATYARDALSKAVYGRLFDWLVRQLNTRLQHKQTGGKIRSNVIGLLDIYGFEVFESNSFEQLCINYCNEKLQQLFINLTLKMEQEEYESEGIQWEPVKYFDNKIICDLIEERHRGIIDILDEECLRPGDPSDQSFLDKLSNTIGQHQRFVTHSLASDLKTRKSINYDEFRLQHYAGQVTYKVNGFLDKNNDLLYRNLKELMSRSANPIISELFTVEELQQKKRPQTVGTQFRTSLNHLMQILMSKDPSYVRCIKPNDSKSPRQFDHRLVHHQVKYLGLMENLRVRRAGFAYRRLYQVFYNRYKCLSAATWPHFSAGPGSRDSVEAICRELGYGRDEFRLGRTKIFIRMPQTLFRTEDLLQRRKHELATLIQAVYRGWRARVRYVAMRKSVTTIASHWRRVLAARLLVRRKQAVVDIRRFIIGFMHRNEARSELNSNFLDFVRAKYLTRCRHQLPATVLDKTWPRAPVALEQTRELLMRLNMKNMMLRYVRQCSPRKREVMQEKLLASQLFRGKKSGYEQSVAQPFKRETGSILNGKQKQAVGAGERLGYACQVTKYDRHGYSARQRTLVVTDTACYVLDSSGKLKDHIRHDNLTGMSCSSLSDNLFVLHSTPAEHSKGDVIMESSWCIETLTKIAAASGRHNILKIQSNKHTISHAIGDDKNGVIEFQTGGVPSIKKAKNGNLLVMVP